MNLTSSFPPAGPRTVKIRHLWRNVDEEKQIDFSAIYVIAGICGATFTLGMLLYFLILRCRQLRHAPPGPIGIWWSSRLTTKRLSGIKAKYGAVFHLLVRNQFTVVLNDLSSITTAFRDNEYCLLERFPHSHSTILQGKTSTSDPFLNSKYDYFGGLTYASYLPWRITRNFINSTLLELQQGPRFSATLEEAAQPLIHTLHNRTKQQLPSFHTTLHKTILHIMVNIMAGSSYVKDFEKMQRFSKLMRALGMEAATGGYNFQGGTCPFASKWSRQCRRVEKYTRRVRKDLNEEISIQRRNEKPSEDTFIGCCLSHMTEIRRFSGKAIDKLIFTDDEVVTWTIELLAGSVIPLVCTLYEGLFLLAKHPVCQLKIQLELDHLRRSGVNRSSALPLESMPYLTAVCCEILRQTSSRTVGACRRVTREFKVGSYRISKGTLLIANLHAIHHDNAVWAYPEVFLPERYFDMDGRLTIPPSLVPFSMGSRSCPGGSIAMRTVMVFIAALMSKYTVTLGDYSNLLIDPPYYDLRFLTSDLRVSMELDQQSVSSVSV